MGQLEFSLGCLQLVIRKSHRTQLTFPLVLQVLDSTECRSCATTTRRRDGFFRAHERRTIITVSDGIHTKVDCFILNSNIDIPAYTIIKIFNVDFDFKIERQRHRPKVFGMILDFKVVGKGNEIGFYSGKPQLLPDVGIRSARFHNPIDNLSFALWKQVKEERCCDVVFRFPGAATTSTAPVPQVMAQKNSLIANSPVFEATFEGCYAEAISRTVDIVDTEPKYFKCLLQFIFTRSVPLLSLKQAFELLYLGDKYELHELKSYCNNFILHNKRSLGGVPDVFTYLEMNEKCQSEEVTQFVWAQLRKHANVLIRLPQFQDLDFQTLEAFLCESDLNAHEWELLEAVRRWVAGNGVSVSCQQQQEGGAGECLHQLLECIRWKYTPVQECVMVQGWSEFKLSTDETFLTDILALQREDGPALSHNQVVANSVNREYSSNRLYNSHQNFVIYTQLTVDRDNNSISCLHGRKVSQLTYNQTKCHTVGPPFELSNFYIVPSYSLSSLSNNRVKLTVNLACQGKNFGEDLMMQHFYRNRPSYLRSLVRLTVFSFSPSNAARSLEKEVNFWPDRDSSSFITLVFSKEEVSHYLRQPESDPVRTMDLQLQLEPLGEEAGGEGRATPPKVMRPDRPAAPRQSRNPHNRTTYDSRIDSGTQSGGVGRMVTALRAGQGWGDVTREPGQPWPASPSPSPTVRDQDVTIEIPGSPAPWDRGAGYGDITRSPQSPNWSSHRYHAAAQLYGRASPPRSPSYSPLRHNAMAGPISRRDSAATEPWQSAEESWDGSNREVRYFSPWPAPASPPLRSRDRSRSPPYSPPHPQYSPVPSPSYSPLTSPSHSPYAPEYIPCSPHNIPSSPPRSPVDLIQILDDAEQILDDEILESLQQENVRLESDSDDDERALVAKNVTMSEESSDPPM